MSLDRLVVPVPIKPREAGSISDLTALQSPQGPPESEMISLARRLYEDLRRAQEGLAFQARHDLLTGLWNRAAILDILHKETARSDRQRMPFAVIVVSIDGLSRINEAHGEIIGDAVLRAASRRISPAIRPYDSMGRTSGNQFLIVAPDL
jgi:GGDEF domain-containing protein